MNENILVTGGAGYLGSTLVPALLESNCKVRVVDNLIYNQSSLNHVCYHKNFEFYDIDVRNTKSMEEHYKWADTIIPLAALVGAPLCEKDSVGSQTINHDSPIHMFRSIDKSTVVLMPTTNSAYGSGNENNFCDETSPLNPISEYAKQKIQVEKELMERENSVSFRLATVFGMSPRMRLDLLVNDFVNKALKERSIVLFESHFKRNYIHVKDIARVFLFALQNFNSVRGEVFNVGLSNANLSKKELCLRIKEYIPQLQIIETKHGKDPDQRNYIVSNTKIESRGYKPMYSIDDGIKELIKGLPLVSHSPYRNF